MCEATCGSHRWKGGAPNFIANIITIISYLRLDEIGAVMLDFNMNTKSIPIDAKAWVRKYFSDAVVLNKFAGLAIIGIKHSIFISNIAQAINHLLEDLKIKVLETIINKNVEFFFLVNIKKRIYFMFGVWAQ